MKDSQGRDLVKILDKVSGNCKKQAEFKHKLKHLIQTLKFLKHIRGKLPRTRLSGFSVL